jgi:hypothetical protein
MISFANQFCMCKPMNDLSFLYGNILPGSMQVCNHQSKHEHNECRHTYLTLVSLGTEMVKVGFVRMLVVLVVGQRNF